MPNKQPWLIDGEALKERLCEYAGDMKKRENSCITDRDYDTASRLHAKRISVERILGELEGGCFNVKTECEACNGQGGITAENFGHVISFECPDCKGSGVLLRDSAPDPNESA